VLPNRLRDMTEKEKAAYKARQDAAAAHANEMQRQMNRANQPGGGGFGNEGETARKEREAKEKAAREAREKALEASVKRLSQIEIEQGRQTDLTKNSERLAAIVVFGSEQEALEARTQAQIKDIRINSDAEIAKAKLEIYSQELLSREQKEKEFSAKQREIRLREVTEISKARNSLTEQLLREEKRIQDIITQSKARVTEEQRLNELLDARNKFVNENVAATDLERKRAEELFNLEQERLKVLRQIALIKDIPPEERLAREKEINTIFDQRREKTIQQQEADKRLTENFSAGFARAYRQYAENARNAFERGSKIFATFTQGMEDGIVNFVKTGKLNFMDLVNTLLEEILRAEIRLLASNIMGSIGGRGNSGSGNFLGNLLGFANGGIIPTNGPVIVGERGPELLMGASGSRVVPNGQFGGGSVTYNINAVDAASFKSMIARDPGFIHAVAQQGARTVSRR
jgi:lambda family phage tail tape measure protein